MPRFQPLLAAFPERAMVIRRAILNDSDFATICDDYIACLTAIDHWTRRPDPDRRCEEYRRTLSEIEVEITEFLARYEALHVSTDNGSPAASVTRPSILDH